MALEVTVSDHYAALTSGVIFSFIGSWIAWGLGFYRFPLPRDKESPVSSLWKVLGAFATFLFTMMGIVPLIVIGWLLLQGSDILQPVNLSSWGQGWTNVFGISFAALSILGYTYLMGAEALRGVWGPKSFKGPERILFDLGVGAATWMLSYPLVVVLGQLIEIVLPYFFIYTPGQVDQVAVRYLKTTMAYPSLFFVTILLIIYVVPIIEETLFRGFLQGWLKEKMGIFSAIVLTSLVFSGFHFSMSQGLDNIELLASLFILSCFLGFLRERQQSLWASIGLHSTFNAISVLAILIEK